MEIFKSPSEDDKNKIVGKRIVNFTAEGVELEDGTKLTWKNECLDGGCYEWLRIRVNGELVLDL